MVNRIPAHGLDDAPAAARPFLQSLIEASPARRFLNLHAQMAHSPAVLAAYMALRAATAEHAKLEPKVSAALTLATAAAVGNGYMLGIAGRLAQMSGWTEAQVAALRTGAPTSDVAIDAM